MVNCITELTCFPTNPLDVLRLPNIIYGIPNAVTLGIFLGILIGAIYIWSRSLVILAILGIYSIAMVSATWAAEVYVQEAYHMVLYIIALSVASLVLMFVMKVLRE